MYILIIEQAWGQKTYFTLQPARQVTCVFANMYKEYEKKKRIHMY